MSEQTRPSIREVQKNLPGADFQRAKTRIEATGRIAQELRTVGLYSRAPLSEQLNKMVFHPDVDMSSFNPLVPDPHRVNAYDYSLQTINMTYHVPDTEESISEELVCFVGLGEGGKPEMLRRQDKPLFLSK